MERLTHLSDKREVERKNEVNSRMEKRFKSTTDDLRQEEAKFNTYAT